MTTGSTKSEVHVLKMTEEYKRALDVVRHREVLELGVGTGALTQLLLDAEAHAVIGWEILPDLCTIKDPRLDLRIGDYTTIKGKDLDEGFCLVANPAYSTLPAIIENILPFVKDVILMVPERAVDDFKALGFSTLFVLEGDAFEPPAKGNHYVMQRGFRPTEQYMKRHFSDLHAECWYLRGETIPDRIAELAKKLPLASLCAIGGFPFTDTSASARQMKWCGEYVTAETIRNHLREALGFSAVLTYTNKRQHSLEKLGQICVDRNESWAYHWVTLTFLISAPSPAVQLAFARDTRFKLGWPVEKEFSGKLLNVFTASGDLSDWIKYTSKHEDMSFDAETRAAMGYIHNLLKGILP